MMRVRDGVEYTANNIVSCIARQRVLLMMYTLPCVNELSYKYRSSAVVTAGGYVSHTPVIKIPEQSSVCASSMGGVPSAKSLPGCEAPPGRQSSK